MGAENRLWQETLPKDTRDANAKNLACLCTHGKRRQSGAVGFLCLLVLRSLFHPILGSGTSRPSVRFRLLQPFCVRRIVWAAERGGAELSLREVPPHAVCKSPVPWSQWYGRDDCCV